MNAQQLKNSILQEAIEGRLVPQDPNDEPASVLLEKIRKEKAKLVKEGKLKKKDLEVKPISENELPFEIPESWEWCRLKSVISGTNAGKSPNCQKRPKVGDEWGVLTTTSIQNGFFLPEENKVLPNNYIIENDYIVEFGDILITRAGPKNRTGIVCVVNRPCDNLILSDKTVRIGYIRNMCNPYFLMHILNSTIIRSIILQASVGMAESQVNISQNSIQNVIIPLPPLAEQKRIVAKIEELLPKVEEYGKAQESLDKLNEELPGRLKKSILQEAIEGRLLPQDPNDEPASVLLDKIRKEKVKLVTGKKLKKKDLEVHAFYEEESRFAIPKGWECAKLSFITSLLDGEKHDGDYVCLDAKYLRGKSSGDILSKGKFVKKNDNIILVDGENSGEVFNVPCDGYMGSTFKQLWVSDFMYLPYVLYYIRSYKEILRNSKKGVAIPHLNKDVFNNLVVGIPPLAEQKRIVAKVEQLLHEIDKLKV